MSRRYYQNTHNPKGNVNYNEIQGAPTDINQYLSSKMTRRILKTIADDAGRDLSQLEKVLRILHGCSNGAVSLISQGRIALEMNISRTTVNHLIKALREGGLIKVMARYTSPTKKKPKPWKTSNFTILSGFADFCKWCMKKYREAANSLNKRPVHKTHNNQNSSGNSVNSFGKLPLLSLYDDRVNKVLISENLHALRAV